MRSEMKRILLPFLLVASIALLLLLFRSGASDPIVFVQNSEKAIFNLQSPEQVEAFLEQGFKVVSPHSNPQTLVRIPAGHGPIHISDLNVESPGEVFVIGSGGLVVEENANLNLNTSEPPLELMPAGNGEGYIELGHSENSAEVIHKGNVYALAINKEGAIQATNPKKSVEKPTTFDYPDLKTAPVISDE
jgi:hypothetical protein|tara:strand:- start:440 stop:1009 length:570 start_codon:yes stop_codon:yes gene_type:complete